MYVLNVFKKTSIQIDRIFFSREIRELLLLCPNADQISEDDKEAVRAAPGGPTRK